MPQLNPAPWFMILVYSWLILLMMIPNKVLNHTFTNDIATLGAEKLKSSTWTWPWH
uniref:ATP synthase F0 subunit 8 n=1 Tax=Noturus leptacanthus TaxID=90665 RepID=UPI00226CE23E|nr:ATP synthase F0 subunit 8 [Noturus leptacanthus]UZC55474.1 ATP synthase subunit 8 [Noturus leptacanthus]UZC55487.1 ATP synthase subunit 8 [Noturus leptacanthus]UZC55500.1 ATP synthase subunit 8 [Noturus leptacanthus]